jgi:hypothetical protein
MLTRVAAVHPVQAPASPVGFDTTSILCESINAPLTVWALITAAGFEPANHVTIGQVRSKSSQKPKWSPNAQHGGPQHAQQSNGWA